MKSKKTKRSTKSSKKSKKLKGSGNKNKEAKEKAEAEITSCRSKLLKDTNGSPNTQNWLACNPNHNKKRTDDDKRSVNQTMSLMGL